MDSLGEDLILRTIYERKRMPLTRTVTSKAEEKAIKQDNHVQPSGHITVVKINRIKNFMVWLVQLLFLCPNVIA